MFLELSSLSQALRKDLTHYISYTLPEATVAGEPSYEVKVRAAHHLMDNMLSKYVTHSDDADRNAESLFHHNNDLCGKWDLQLESESDSLLWGTFCDKVYRFFTDSVGDDAETNWMNVAECARTGPGSAILANGTSFYAKMFSSRLSSTSESLYQLYVDDVMRFPLWVTAEISRIITSGRLSLVEGSRSTFVPKKFDISRQIGVEPSLNQYFQLGYGTLLERRLYRVFGIDLANQPDKNRLLAQLGSVSWWQDDSIATIDLRSASDRLSLKLAGRIIPQDDLDMMLSMRSPTTSINGEVHPLQMMSMMGNGFTFPLQTAIFACIVSAAYSLEGIPLSTDWHNSTFGVFGDDIAVVRRALPKVLRLLALSGFEVNADKTFETGSFKESCGHDYYHGHNIRPVYLRKMNSVQDAYSFLNLLSEWSARTRIFLPATTSYIVEKIPANLRLPVPLGDDVSSGIRIPEGLIGIPLDHNRSYMYKSFRTRPRSYSLGERLVSPRGVKALSMNPAGLMLSLLKGEWRHGKLATRHSGESIPWTLGRRVAPNWNYTPISPNYVKAPSLFVTSGQLAAATTRNFANAKYFLW